jgi:hypothetical protein
VVDKLGLSFHNIRGLHQVVDSIPPRAQWKTRQLWYKSDPNDKHTIYHRNPCDVISSLLGNPAFANDIVYRPKKIFTNSSKTARIYNEMWTGDWWHSVQVSISGEAVEYHHDLQSYFWLIYLLTRN